MPLLFIPHQIYVVHGHESFKKCTRGRIIIVAQYVLLNSLSYFLYQSRTTQVYHQWTNAISELKTKTHYFGKGISVTASLRLKLRRVRSLDLLINMLGEVRRQKFEEYYLERKASTFWISFVDLNLSTLFTALRLNTSQLMLFRLKAVLI